MVVNNGTATVGISLDDGNKIRISKKTEENSILIMVDKKVTKKSSGKVIK